jgi:HD superfamily phosphohydrolase YqeK
MKFYILILVCLCVIAVYHSEEVVGSDEEFKHKVEELHTFLSEKTIDELKNYCLRVDSYIRKKKGIKVYGGVHDYVHKLTKDQLINYVIKNAIVDQELLDLFVLKQVVAPATLSFIADEPRTGGLHDYIYRTPRETLIIWALTSERYEQGDKSAPMAGGLHDRIRLMSDMEIADYILDHARKFPELDSAEKLNELAIKYKFVDADDTKLTELNNYLQTQTREKLLRFALAIEEYHRKVNNILFILTGFEKYARYLENDKLIEYILREVKEHRELDDPKKLEGLLQENVTVLLSGGLHDYIFRQPRSTLAKWALTTEKYHRKVNNLHLMGGLHDYIGSLNEKQLIDYILKETREHPEIDSGEKLDKLSADYGLEI